MPPHKLWTFVRSRSDNCIYVKSEDEVKQSYGAVLEVRTVKDKATHVKVKFHSLQKARKLSLTAFSWSDNSFSRLFHGSGDSTGFLQVWEKNVQPFLHASSGAFSPPSSLPSTGNTEIANASTPSLSHDASTSSAGLRKRPSVTTPPTLMPATKIARVQQEQAAASVEPDSSSTKEMDETIATHFLGFYMLPVSSLLEPPDELLVRETSQVFIEGLKAEMLENPTSDVQPILALVRLKEGENFDSNLKEGYVYETVGGNHSRQAIQELLKEHPELHKRKVYSHRLCSVYRKMETSLALRLASKHNRASTFIHDMTTGDKVSLCRRLLYEIGTQDLDKEPPAKPPTWKKSCAAVLSQTVEQLDDAMVFFLASLPCEAYNSLTIIIQKFSDGHLKGQHIPRSKKGTLAKPPELKGSKLKCLRGIPEDVIRNLLTEVAEENISLAELNSECTSIKQIQKVQSAFIKGTNCDSWAEAQQKYPQYATAQQLEPFKMLNFSSKLPEQFLKFCQRCMQRESTVTSECGENDTVFCTTANNSSCIFWKENTLQTNPTKLRSVFQSTGASYVGFPLSVFDVPGEEWSGQVAAQLVLLVRALNFQVSVQDFTVVFLCSLESLGDVLSALKPNGDTVQIGACIFTHKVEAPKPPPSRVLHENTHGVVIIRCGNPPPLHESATNGFVFTQDAPVLSDVTKKPVSPAQKPVAFFQKVIRLYTVQGEWVLNGYSGIGSCSIAALLEKRNCVAVENDPVLFIQSKVHAVEVLNPSTTPEDDSPTDALVQEPMDPPSPEEPHVSEAVSPIC